MIQTKPTPSQQELHELFEFTASGHLIWKPRERAAFNTRFAGKIAGCLDADGYRYIIVLGRPYRAHRLVWKFHHGTEPGETLDHINHDRDDNRIENLRDVSFAENMRNRSRPATNVTRKRDRFQAQYRHNGRTIYAGLFPTFEAAQVGAYERAVSRGHIETRGGK